MRREPWPSTHRCDSEYDIESEHTAQTADFCRAIIFSWSVFDSPHYRFF